MEIISSQRFVELKLANIIPLVFGAGTSYYIIILLMQISKGFKIKDSFVLLQESEYQAMWIITTGVMLVGVKYYIYYTYSI